MRKFGLCIIIAIVSSSLLYADDSWPAWRGPEFTGVAAGCNPPTAWSETQNIKWKVSLTGDASSGSPIVWKDKIFFQSAVKTDKVANPGVQDKDNKLPTNIYKFNLVCLDRATGKILWETTACENLPHQNHHEDHGFASFSPVTDGKYIWAYFGSQGMACFDFDGKIVWKKEMPKMKAMFGEAGSPALAGDAVIVCADSDNESAIYAFNKTTGDILWKTKRDEKTSWATPVVVPVDGALQVIVGTSKIRSYDAKTGALIWECGKDIKNGIPTPVVGFDSVFCTSGGRGSGMVQAVKLYKEAIAPADANSVIWENKEASPHIASPLLYGRRLYVFSNNPARLSCFDAKTGEVLFEKQPLEQLKDKNPAYASPVGAADKVYMTGRNGVTVVVKNADTFEVLSINPLDDVIDGTPAIVDNEIILKGKKSIYCIAEKK
jgi:outer membrane protein assembly factor BamB